MKLFTVRSPITARGPTTHPDMLTTMALMLAVIVSGVVAASLFAANKRMTGSMQARRVIAAEVPVPGRLTGRNAIDGQIWPPRADGDAQEPYEKIVLFPLSATTANEGIDYWREVATRVGVVAPEVKFVGICQPAIDCNVQRDAGIGPMTLLTAMDPLQMRAIAVAKSRKVALLYESSSFKKDVVIVGRSESALAEEIVNAFVRETKGTP